jgi:hypothetical protein
MNTYYTNLNTDYNYVINELQNYMLNEKNMKHYISNINNSINNENKENNINIKKTMILPEKEKKEKIEKKEKTKKTFLKEKDTLFWSFYIMVNGDVEYELLQPINLIIEKKIKIEYIEKLRQNKGLLKQYKYATLVHMENQLLNEQRIDINTFFSLCLLEKLNILYINKNTYYEFALNESNSKIFILYHLDKKYSFEIGVSEAIEKYKSELFQIENFSKPLKSISSYKLQELKDFCKKLGIQTQQQTEDKKNIGKKELYESLIQYF